MCRPFIFFLFCLGSALAEEKPNILWIVSEDNNTQWLGCYGNKQAQTPHIDQLAQSAVMFNKAYSNAPVCAVARSTIINGAYAITQGTQHMRSRHPIPNRYKPYVSYLKEHGYYCTNRSKTDYNFKGDDKSIWDKCSSKAHYSSRPDGAPFFAIFNLTVSHESSLFPERIKSNRKRGRIPKEPRIAPSNVMLPPYLPDLPEIRKDIAIYYDNITALDSEVGKILADLKKADLDENTIVFYYSDHGGTTPRGKRYLKDTGIRVPMIIHFPKKWQHLSPYKAGEKTDEIVSFVDLAPTLLSLLGLEKPEQMQGRAFLGSKHTEAPKENFALLFADRFDVIYGMRRGITDGRWKYIRRFTPQLSAAPYSYYQFSQAGWTAWQKAWGDGKLTGRFKDIWEPHQPVEELFDTQSDPWEIKNLAADSAHADKLTSMRKQLKKSMIKTRDTGLIPEPMFATLAPNKPITNYMDTQVSELSSLTDLAFAASSREVNNLEKFIRLTESSNPLQRYWAAQGLLILGKNAAPAEKALFKILGDKHSVIRVTAAQALYALGHKKQSHEALIAELNKNLDEYSLQNLTNSLTLTRALDQVPQAWVTNILADPKAGQYILRFASRLEKSRKKQKSK